LTRQSLETFQVFIYLGAILSGLLIGSASPGTGKTLESALWPILGCVLYATFTQVPLSHIRDALVDFRFLTAAIVGNFVVIPVMVWGLMALLPDDPAIHLGVLLVLLVPCTDWFITFTHLGGGDTMRAIAFSPVSLVLQIILLRLDLLMFLREHFTATVAQSAMLLAFVGLILVPLLAAFVTQQWAERVNSRGNLLTRLAWFPVPLLAVVILIIAATQVHVVMGSIGILRSLLLVFVAFLLMAGVLARLLARQFRLPPSQGRVLAFSLGTRNSFVVLPLALALPPSYELAIVAIVFQSLVELFGMMVYLWWVPQRLFPPENE
jgi:arsenite transporter